FPTFVGDGGVAMFFIDHVIAGHRFGFAGLVRNRFAAFELGDNAIYASIFVGGFFAGPRNNKRGAGLVDQDGIHFINDGEIVLALHALLQVKLHVVAQIVEAEFVIGAVVEIGCVGDAALLIFEIMHD